MDSASILGYAAGALTTIAFVPQIINDLENQINKRYFIYHAYGFLFWDFFMDDIWYYTAFHAGDHCQFNWPGSGAHYFNFKN